MGREREASSTSLYHRWPVATATADRPNVQPQVAGQDLAHRGSLLQLDAWPGSPSTERPRGNLRKTPESRRESTTCENAPQAKKELTQPELFLIFSESTDHFVRRTPLGLTLRQIPGPATGPSRGVRGADEECC